MGHAPLSVETVHGSTQVTVHGLLQMTVLADGSVQIDLDSKRVEVERNMSINQLIVRHERSEIIKAHDSALAEPVPSRHGNG